MSGIREASIEAEFYRVIKNLISEGETRFHSMEFTKVTPQYSVDGGYADLVVFAKEDEIEKPILVIETKRKLKDRTERRFDPYSPSVIDQAAFYAMKIGADYFATTNGEVFVSFQTFKTGVSLPERRVKPYKIQMLISNEIVKSILEDLTKLHTGIEKWLPLDEVFVNRLQYFHSFIQPLVKGSLDSKLLDLEFKNRYEDWVKRQLFEVSENTNEQMASQAAYLLMNRILFYKTLETQRTDLPLLHKIDFTSGGDFTIKLREYFGKVLAIDYQAIFEEGVLNEIPVSNPLAETLNDFIEELDTYNLSTIRSDILGRVYENLIPEDERHRLGQYYTPPPIVELITEMCIRSPNDNVLDPGCGSGGFLVKAYHKLKELKKEENPLASDEVLHNEILTQLYGIDINQFPASLSSINLATRNLKATSDVIDVFVSDFFKVRPSMALFPEEGFEVVVANPPYTRQEEMEYKDQIREEALTYSDDSKIPLDARAGIYAYFFTHAAKFLKNQGMMGQITSDTWLDVGFGEDLKQFFLDHFKVHAIIWYDVRAFERALVGTCITILEKEDERKEKRENNIVEFVRIKKAMPAEEIVRTIETAKKDFEDNAIGITCVKQGLLKPEEKWGRYLRAPIIYYRIIKHPRITNLGNTAEVRFGLKTGAVEFFHLDDEKVKLWGIEREYLRPVVTSPKHVNLEIRPEDVSEWVLMVHEPKDILQKKNAKVLKYIEYGETAETRVKGGTSGGSTVRGYQNISSVRSRKLWYDLGMREPAPILRYRRIWERCVYSLNTAKAYSNDTFNEIYPKSKEDTVVLAGILNSSVTALLSELHGRFYGGGVLELEVYEAKELPVIDPSKLSDDERKAIETSFMRLCEAQRKGDSKSEEEARQKLDNVVFDILGLNASEKKQIYDGLDSLRSMRLQRKEVKVLVETAEKWEPLIKQKKKGAKSSEGISKRLETWMK
jgi:type I restriction-modification system DNA methylase subunit